ncbi:MAG: hypothetical protein WC480_04635 [Patescibacteria group bacterium]
MVIDLSFLSQIPMDNPLIAGWFIFTHGAWVFFVLPALWAMYDAWITYRRTKYSSRWEYILLSVDIPKNIETVPKAVEYIFAAMAGAWKKVDWIEKYFLGKIQVKFSFELVSIEGYVQYLIYTPRHFRDLVEAAVYGQYPGAEVTEVPDYAANFKMHWPDHDQGYDIWGTVIKPVNKEYYPIRTYDAFVADAPKKQYHDPMAAILENMAKLGPGEQFWWQVIITPTNQRAWQHEAGHYLEQLLHQKGHSKGIFGHILDGIAGIAEAIIGIFSAAPETETKPEAPELKVKDKVAAEGIQKKVAKVVVRAKLRVVYIARKEVFNKHKVKEGFLGAMHQFTDNYLNGLVQDKNTKVSTSHLYYFRNYRVNHYRKNKILKKYKTRSTLKGSEFNDGKIMAADELATIWHFPVGVMGTIALKKVEVKKTEAPFTLPVETPRFGPMGSALEEKVNIGLESAQLPDRVGTEEVGEIEPPDNLPIG